MRETTVKKYSGRVLVDKRTRAQHCAKPQCHVRLTHSPQKHTHTTKKIHTHHKDTHTHTHTTYRCARSPPRVSQREEEQAQAHNRLENTHTHTHKSRRSKWTKIIFFWVTLCTHSRQFASLRVCVDARPCVVLYHRKHTCVAPAKHSHPLVHGACLKPLLKRLK